MRCETLGRRRLHDHDLNAHNEEGVSTVLRYNFHNIRLPENLGRALD
jgi:hypothetical protein